MRTVLESPGLPSTWPEPKTLPARKPGKSGRSLAALFFLLLGLLTIPVQAKRFALVIGNNTYEPTKASGEGMNLVNAVNDARLISKTLREIGFEVLLVEDASLDAIYSALEKMKQQASGASLGLLYFSGHGMEVDGLNYLLPVDARLSTKAQIRSQTIPLDTVLNDLAQANMQAKMLILDCCRNNPFKATRQWMQTRSEAGGLAVIDRMPESTLIMYSSGPGQTASDGRGSNSPFTEVFSEVITKPGLSCFDAFFMVSDHVKAQTSSRQQPWVKFDGAADAFRRFTFRGGAPSAKIDHSAGIVQISQQDYQNMQEEVERLKAEAAAAQAAGQTPVANASPGQPAGTSQQIEAESAASAFLQSWFRNQASNSPQAWASDFAPFPDYCYWEGSGGAPQAFIEEDRRKLISRYSQRSYEQIGNATAKWFNDFQKGILVVTYHYQYEGVKKTSGNSIVTLGLTKVGRQWKIAAFDETVRKNAYNPGGSSGPTLQPAAAPGGRITKEALNQFLSNWIKNNASNSEWDWASDFAQSVHYCYKDDGPANQAFLRNDRSKLIKKYPTRKYQIIEATFDLLENGSARLATTFSYDYGRASGKCKATMILASQGDRLLITSFNEEVIRK